jgi:hypothetical protein
MQLAMKKILAILFVFLFAGSFGNADIFDDIANSLRSGDARAVSRFFGNTVDLTIINQEEVYSKMQAEQILRDFFSKNTPRSFNIIHQGVKEGARYAIGNLTTTQGVVFRTYFFVKTQSGNSMIQELRFMKE